MDLNLARILAWKQCQFASPIEFIIWAKELIATQFQPTEELLELANVDYSHLYKPEPEDNPEFESKVDDIFRKAISSMGIIIEPENSVKIYAELLAQGILDGSLDLSEGCKELSLLYKLASYAEFLSPWVWLEQDLYVATQNISGDVMRTKSDIRMAAENLVSPR
jgi:hypothetical protein